MAAQRVSRRQIISDDDDDEGTDHEREQKLSQTAESASMTTSPVPMQPAAQATTMNELVQLGKKAFKDKIVLYYAKEMRSLAEEIVRRPEARGRIVLGEVEWNRFADGFPDLNIQNAKHIKWAHVAYLASLHSPSVIFEQISLIYSIPRYLAKTFKVILPYFPTGTMERIESLGEVATAKTLARLFDMVPSAARGPTQIVIFDIHTLQNQFYFDDRVLIRLKSCTTLVRQRIKALPDADKVSIAFPDEGAFKRFGSKFQDYPIIICHKVRDGDKRIVKLKEGDVQGRHVVIVDDLVQSGSTLIEAGRTLRHSGAAHVSAYVTHAIFPNDSWKRFVDNQEFSFFWISNTNPITEQLINRKPFEVLSVAPIAASVIVD